MSEKSSIWFEVGVELDEEAAMSFLKHEEGFKNEACAKLVANKVTAERLGLVFQHATRPSVIISAIDGFIAEAPGKDVARSVIKSVPEDGLPEDCAEAVLRLFDYILDEDMKSHKHNYTRHVMKGHGKQLVLYNHPAWR